MATKYPLILNNVRFYVNPTSLKISKATNISSLNTQGGVKYYVWYDTPEMLSISGQSAGDTAYKELVFLRDNYERTNKVSDLFYKTTVYKGIITQLNVGLASDNPNKFTYEINFQLLYGEQFRIEDFSLVPSGFLNIAMQGAALAEDYVNVNLANAENSILRKLGVIQ